MDGINGITGGYSWVVLLALAFINVQIVRFVEEDLIYTMLCAVLVFNFFNFRKKAKCFAGDVGSPVHLPSTDISVSDVANQYFHVA